MKLVNYKLDNQIRLGLKVDKGIIDVEKAVEIFHIELPCSMEEAIQYGTNAFENLLSILDENDNSFLIDEDSILFAPVILNPEKILCIGLNYASHGEEFNMNIVEYPVVFSKFNNCLTGHNCSIQIPEGIHNVDYEAELVIIIGKEANKVSKEEALSYIFGYTVGNDLTSRELQFRTSQWFLGKSCDNFAPMGPYLVTADEVNPNDLEIFCYVNGELRQSANTKDMIFDCATIVSYISNYITLKPGDVIYTGTPSGVILGYPEEKQIWLKSKDVVEVCIEKIGTLRNIMQ